jgi:putative oligomerization/nucleic acid binding protein
VRTSSNTLWLLVVVAMLAVVAARLSRSLGAFGLILTVFLVIVLVRLLRDLLQSRFRRSGDDHQPPATKNVTPQEGWLPPGVRPTGGPAATPAPSVIVVDPPDATEQLEAKLEALDRLRASGLVTDDEYEAKRAKLIADF